MANSYHAVAAEIRRRIESGAYPSDQPLPPERALGEAFGVHRATLRRAVASLEAQGLVRRSPGDRPYPRAARPIEGTIGFYAAEDDRPTRSLIAAGLVEGLRARGSALRLVWSDDHAFMPGEPFSPEVRAHVGLVLWPPSLTDVDRLRTLRASMPTVIVDAPVSGYESDFVGYDDEVAGYEATRHLVDAGHRRLAFVGCLHAVTARYRRLGFTRLLRERGLEPVTGYESLTFSCDLPRPVLDAFLDPARADRPTALVCENDETAARLMPHLAERGVRVPDDFALVGFGGAQPVLLSALGLTTMEQPFVEVGRRAARLLLDRLEGPRGEGTEQVRLPMRLRARASSGPPTVPAEWRDVVCGR